MPRRALSPARRTCRASPPLARRCTRFRSATNKRPRRQPRRLPAHGGRRAARRAALRGERLTAACPGHVGYHQVMQFTVEIGNRQWEIAVEPGAPPAVRVDGEAVPATLHAVGPDRAGAVGHYMLLVGNRALRACHHAAV